MCTSFFRCYSRFSVNTPHSSHAAADMFVLLSWCCGLYVACLECNPDFPQTRSWTALLGNMAILVDMILDPSTRSKKSLQKSALVRTRRALRYVRLPMCSYTPTYVSIESREPSRSHEGVARSDKVPAFSVGRRATSWHLRRRHPQAQKRQERKPERDRYLSQGEILRAPTLVVLLSLRD